MKVKIGPYINWVGPYQIANALCFWAKETKDECGIPRKPDWVHNFGTWLAEDRNGKDSWLSNVCNWIHSKQKRQVYVRIDKFDTWSMDQTLAHIVLPMLEQLKVTKHGAPCVDDEDVPNELKSTSAEPKENEWDTDSNHFLRWDWVLDEMIFAFECKLDEDWDAQFWTGEYGDFKSIPTGEQFLNPITNKLEDTYTMEITGNRECDWDGRKQMQDRITNGLCLFGKYYEALWD
jgi:Zn-finger protein